MSNRYCDNCGEHLHYDITLCGECETAIRSHERGYTQGLEAGRAQGRAEGYAECTADAVAYVIGVQRSGLSGLMAVSGNEALTTLLVRIEAGEHVGASAKKDGE